MSIQRSNLNEAFHFLELFDGEFYYWTPSGFFARVQLGPAGFCVDPSCGQWHQLVADPDGMTYVISPPNQGDL